MRHFFSSSYTSMNKLAFTLAAFHIFAIPHRVFTSNNAVRILPFLLFIGLLIVGLFGSCFVICGQGHKLAHKIVCNGARSAIFLLFVAVTGAISNVLQNATFDVFGGKLSSLLIGGAIGGIVTIAGAFASQEIEKLSPVCLTITGGVCIATSIFGCFTVILALLVGQGLL